MLFALSDLRVSLDLTRRLPTILVEELRTRKFKLNQRADFRIGTYSDTR
jgi:hypothetical protein